MPPANTKQSDDIAKLQGDEKLKGDDLAFKAKKGDGLSDSDKNSVEANTRLSRPPPSQAEVDLAELREALASIKGFPFPGTQVSRLGVTQDDAEDMAYTSEWTAEGAGHWCDERASAATRNPRRPLYRRGDISRA